MASYGLLIGLGEGLQGVSKSLMDMNKTKFEEELVKKREERAQARKIEDENRAEIRLRTTPDPAATTFAEKDGVLFEQIRSKAGDLLEERLANKMDIDRINLEKRKAEASIQADLAMGQYRGLQIQQTALENQFLPTKQAAELENIKARTAASNRSNRPNSSSQSLVKLRDALVAESPNVVARYAEGEDALISQNELKMIAQDVVKEFAGRGYGEVTSKDLEVAVVDFLRRMKRNKTAKGNGVVQPVKLNTE